MLVIDFISDLRSRMGDTHQPYLWTDDEFLLYLNQTIQEIACEFGIYRYDNQEVKTVANTYQYSVIGEPVRAVLGGISLMPVSRDIINRDIAVGLTGIPTEFNGVEGTLMVYPIPDDEYSMWVTLRSIPVYTMSSNIDFPNTELLTLGCMYRAYLKQDSDVYSGSNLNVLYQMYQAKFNRLKSMYVRDRNMYVPSCIHPGLL